MRPESRHAIARAARHRAQGAPAIVRDDDHAMSAGSIFKGNRIAAGRRPQVVVGLAVLATILMFFGAWRFSKIEI